LKLISSKDGKPMRDDPQVTDLVRRASNGDRQAWDAIAERYAPLIWSICHRYRLGGPDAEDVAQVGRFDHEQQRRADPGHQRHRRPQSTHVTETVYRHVIVPEIRGGATVMDDVFNDDEDD
jgi:hypothetical protein